MCEGWDCIHFLLLWARRPETSQLQKFLWLFPSDWDQPRSFTSSESSLALMPPFHQRCVSSNLRVPVASLLGRLGWRPDQG